MYYILLEDLQTRTQLISYLKEQGINAVFHYVPLHSSPAGKHYGKAGSHMDNTNRISESLLRLPLFPSLEQLDVEKIVSAIKYF